MCFKSSVSLKHSKSILKFKVSQKYPKPLKNIHKLYIFLFQKERARTQSQSDESKITVLRCKVQWQTSGTQDLLGCKRPRQLLFSDSRSTTHTTCLVGSCQPHSIAAAVLVCHSILQTSLKSQSLQLGSPSQAALLDCLQELLPC